MQWRRSIFVFLAALCCVASGFDQDRSKHGSDPLTFIRQFSSAQDVRRTHPALDKTLDIVAGPKDETQTNEILQKPKAIAADTDKRVFVLDAGSHAIHVFDFARGKYSLLQAEDRMQSPVGIATDQQGTLYVTDKSSRSILVFDARGKFSRELMKTHGKESYFEEPRGIAIHRPSGRLYVCDGPRSMVVILDKRGKVLGHMGKRGGGKGPGRVQESGASRSDWRRSSRARRRQLPVPGIRSARTLSTRDARGRLRRAIWPCGRPSWECLHH